MKTTISKITTTTLRPEHLSKVLLVEKFAKGTWTKKDFVDILSSPFGHGIVACIHGKIVGFAIFSFLKDKVSVVNMAVHSSYLGQGVDVKLIETLKTKLNSRRTCLEINIRESDLSTHLSLRDQGLKAVTVLRNWYECEDAYTFHWKPNF